MTPEEDVSIGIGGVEVMGRVMALSANAREYMTGDGSAKARTAGNFAKVMREEATDVTWSSPLSREGSPDEKGKINMFECKEIADRILKHRQPEEAIGSIFDGQHSPSQIPAMVVAISNYLLEGHKEDRSLAPALVQFYMHILAGAQMLDPEYAQEARQLGVIAGQALNIISWTKREIKGAEDMRLTAEANKMVQSPDKGRDPRSFLDINTMPVKQAAGEGKAGIYWRGSEGTAKMGENILKHAKRGARDFEETKADVGLYIMDHGWMEVPADLRDMTDEEDVTTIHETSFLISILQGPAQHVSTGPGHFQKTMDIKYVTEGEGIQYNKFYNAEGRLVAVLAQRLKAGSWAVALPGAVDSMENLGGLRFNDISVKVDSDTVNHILKSIDPELEFGSLTAAEDTIKEASKTAPYVVVDKDGKPEIVKNLDSAPDITWTENLLPASLFGDQPLTDLYKTLDASGVAEITNGIAETVIAKAEKNFKAETAPVLMVIGIESGLEQDDIDAITAEMGLHQKGAVRIVALDDKGSEEERMMQLEKARREYNALWSGKINARELGGAGKISEGIRILVRQIEKEETRRFVQENSDRIRTIIENTGVVSESDIDTQRDAKVKLRQFIKENITYPVMMSEIHDLSLYNLNLTSTADRIMSLRDLTVKTKDALDNERIDGKMLLRADSLGELKMLAETHRARMAKGVKVHVRLVLDDKEASMLKEGNNLANTLKNMEIDDLTSDGKFGVTVLTRKEANSQTLRGMYDNYAAGYTADQVAIADSVKSRAAREKDILDEGLILMEYEGLATTEVYDMMLELMAHRNDTEQEKAAFIEMMKNVGLDIGKEGWFVFKPAAPIDPEQLREEIEQYHAIMIAA